MTNAPQPDVSDPFIRCDIAMNKARQAMVDEDWTRMRGALRRVKIEADAAIDALVNLEQPHD